MARSIATGRSPRETIDQSHMTGKEVDDELLRLQAAYAKACATLRLPILSQRVQLAILAQS